MKDVLKLFDSYSLVARLYPALLTLAPAALTVALTTSLALSTKTALSVAFVTAGATFLVNLARSHGKAVESKLLQQWGGWPTTTLLRHRDIVIERPTKARYHAELERLCPGLKMPTAAEEGQRPAEADETYRSATRRLIEMRRDEKYKLLHKENASYGFRRNLLGLKPMALWVIVACMAWSACIFVVGMPVPLSWHALAADIGTRSPLYVAAAVNTLSALLWVTQVRRNFVCRAAVEYALALFRTLEEVPAPAHVTVSPST